MTLFLERRYPASHQLHTVLLVDAARWATPGTASVFSPAFAQAARLALRFKLYTLQLGAANHPRNRLNDTHCDASAAAQV